jgi:hypothetical protein
MTSLELIEAAVEQVKRNEEIISSAEIISLDYQSVHVVEKVFRDNFPEYAIMKRDMDSNPALHYQYELYTVLNGVRVFTLSQSA